MLSENSCSQLFWYNHLNLVSILFEIVTFGTYSDSSEISMPQKLYGSPLPEGCLLLLVIPFKFHLSLLHSYERSDKLFGSGLQDVFTNSIFSGVLSTLNVHYLESTLNHY